MGDERKISKQNERNKGGTNEPEKQCQANFGFSPKQDIGGKKDEWNEFLANSAQSLMILGVTNTNSSFRVLSEVVLRKNAPMMGISPRIGTLETPLVS